MYCPVCILLYCTCPATPLSVKALAPTPVSRLNLQIRLSVTRFPEGVNVFRSPPGHSTKISNHSVHGTNAANHCMGQKQPIIAWDKSKHHCMENERKSGQAHIPHAPTLLENAVYNEWQFQELVTGNQTENQFHLSCTK